MMLHTKYQSSRLCGFGEEDFYRFSYEKLISPVAGAFVAWGHNLNNLVRGPLGDAACQISQVWALWFQRRRFLKVFLYKSM